ncbi:MAG: hypothetical protein ACPGXK_00165 [Phycisphaerae bacterium]
MMNSSYERSGSINEAHDFIQASRILLVRRPKRVKQGEQEIDIDLTLIPAEIKAARQWIAVNDTGGGVSYASCQFFRD